MGEIATNMRQYMQAHPDLRFIFFGGKGGVGKTVAAGVTAQWLAGPVSLGTPVVFDIGVFLVVTGVALLMIFTLAEEF